ncbi:MAG TPA: LptF/LptG family permease [Leptolyngbyaceae cyanobacterium]
MLKSLKFSFPVFSLFGISVMDRYLIGELIGPFVFGVGVFSSLGVAIGSLFDLMRKITEAALPIEVAAKVSLLQMPLFIFYALPMGMLLAALLTYSRLSSDSELIALRSCGVSIYRLILPALIMSIIVTAIAFLFNEWVVPASKYEATLTLQKALNQEQKNYQESNIIYPEYGTIKKDNGEETEILSRLFYAEQFDGAVMKNLTILDRSQTGMNQIVVSESAVWNPQQNNWDFFNGTIYLVSSDSSYRNILRFEHHQLQLPRTPLDFAQKRRDYPEMNILQAREELKLAQLSNDTKRIRKLLIRIHQKIALPFACLAFGLVGAILGCRPQRTNKATGFGVSVLVIFAYYLLMSMGDALGLSAVIPAWLAAWLPNIFGLGVGSLLLIRMS